MTDTATAAPPAEGDRCHDQWCVAMPHPGEPRHVDATGFTWTDEERDGWGRTEEPVDDDPDARADELWEAHQDAGTFPGWM